MPPRRAVTGRSQDPRKRFAEELEVLRTARGETLRHLGGTLGWDWSLFGKMESGQTIGSPEVAEALDQHYGTTPMLLTLWELAAGDVVQFREQYRRYMALEAQAVSLWHHAVSVLPGLLQTDGYAREVLAAGGASGDDLDRQVEARTSRGELLTADGAPPFRTILSEAVLRTPLSDDKEWRRQLEYLLEMTERPNISVHVLHQDAGVHGLVSTDVMFLRLPDARTVAWIETAHHAELIEETIAVERLLVTYDAVRDLALTPAGSRTIIKHMLEDDQCPST